MPPLLGRLVGGLVGGFVGGAFLTGGRVGGLTGVPPLREPRVGLLTTCFAPLMVFGGRPFGGLLWPGGGLWGFGTAFWGFARDPFGFGVGFGTARLPPFAAGFVLPFAASFSCRRMLLRVEPSTCAQHVHHCYRKPCGGRLPAIQKRSLGGGHGWERGGGGVAL